MMDDKFCCYGTYNPRSERCLLKCPFTDCKFLKYINEMGNELEKKEEEEDAENIEG